MKMQLLLLEWTNWSEWKECGKTLAAAKKNTHNKIALHMQQKYCCAVERIDQERIRFFFCFCLPFTIYVIYDESRGIMISHHFWIELFWAFFYEEFLLSDSFNNLNGNGRWIMRRCIQLKWHWLLLHNSSSPSLSLGGKWLRKWAENYRKNLIGGVLSEVKPIIMMKWNHVQLFICNEVLL